MTTTILLLPDGRTLEQTPEIRTFAIPRNRYPGYEIDGERYEVPIDAPVSELAYYPPTGGAAVMLPLELIAPHTN